MKTTITLTQKNSAAIAIDALSRLKLLAMASARLRQTEQPVKVGMTVTHKSYGAGKVVDEWRTIMSGVPCKDIFDVIFQNRSGRPFLHCCRKECLTTPNPLSLPSEDVATRPVRIRTAGPNSGKPGRPRRRSIRIRGRDKSSSPGLADTPPAVQAGAPDAF
jgi:hypothetical protein